MGGAAENLVSREFKSHGPRAIFLTDTTYIPFCGEGSGRCDRGISGGCFCSGNSLLVKHHGILSSKEAVIHCDQTAHSLV